MHTLKYNKLISNFNYRQLKSELITGKNSV